MAMIKNIHYNQTLQINLRPEGIKSYFEPWDVLWLQCLKLY